MTVIATAAEPVNTTSSTKSIEEHLRVKMAQPASDRSNALVTLNDNPWRRDHHGHQDEPLKRQENAEYSTPNLSARGEFPRKFPSSFPEN